MKRFFFLVLILTIAFIIAGCRNHSLRTYTVTFNIQGIGTAPEALTVAEGSKLTAVQTPIPTDIPTDKGFDGWFKDTSCTQPWNYATDTVTKDITLYAKWRNALPLTPIEPLYTVTFNTQGIGTAPEALTVAEGSKLTAVQTPIPTDIPTDKGFDGWFKDTSCTQPWNYATDTVTKDITLYAKWRNALPLTPIEPSTPLYTVTFNTRNLTSPLTPITVIKNHTIPATDIPNPTHRTWNFSGWYKDKNCNAQWNTASNTVTADITLYAKWTPKTLSKQDLWESKKTEGSTNYFRIPALAQTKDGTLIAVTDLRYNHTADIGKFGPNGEWGQASHIHRVDVIIKRSTDNGLTWDSSSTKITNAPDNPVQYGYGDAAIVADRESDNVLIICAHGDTRYGHYKAENANTWLKVVRLRSSDGGGTFTQPEEITTSIYGLNSNWGTLFFGSGKIMQSRRIKKNKYYRIYTAILITDTAGHLFGNAVLYSDDFGETWQVLGDATVSPIPNGNEAKIEELPDGRVLLSSRTVNGRLFNIFTYTNEETASGHWESGQKAQLENERGTNGEICIIQARKIDTKALVYLALQSIPLSSKPHPKGGYEPNIRMNVGIYWGVIEENISLSALADSTKWKKYQVFTGESGYSTMVMQQDHRIGFLYEKYDHVTKVGDMNDVYDICYESLPISTITGDEYEAAFLTE